MSASTGIGSAALAWTAVGIVTASKKPKSGRSWGLQFEAISYPKGLGYEKNASTVLWKPTEPAK